MTLTLESLTIRVGKRSFDVAHCVTTQVTGAGRCLHFLSDWSRYLMKSGLRCLQEFTADPQSKHSTDTGKVRTGIVIQLVEVFADCIDSTHLKH